MLPSSYDNVGIKRQVKNIGTKSREVPYNVWTLPDTQRGVYEPELPLNVTTQDWPNVTRGNWWQGYTSQPGDTINGVVVFVVPQDVQRFKSLTYNDDVTTDVTTL